MSEDQMKMIAELVRLMSDTVKVAQPQQEWTVEEILRREG